MDDPVDEAVLEEELRALEARRQLLGDRACRDEQYQQRERLTIGFACFASSAFHRWYPWRPVYFTANTQTTPPSGTSGNVPGEILRHTDCMVR